MKTPKVCNVVVRKIPGIEARGRIEKSAGHLATDSGCSVGKLGEPGNCDLVFDKATRKQATSIEKAAKKNGGSAKVTCE